MQEISTEAARLLRTSWAEVMPIADKAASRFYGRLFELDPGLHALFADTDMAAQRGKLVRALSSVVDSVEDLSAVLPALRNLGARHVSYGVKPAHYETVGSALLWTLEHELGDRFKPATREAWATAYALIADVMRVDGDVDARSST